MGYWSSLIWNCSALTNTADNIYGTALIFQKDILFTFLLGMALFLSG